MAYKAGSLVVDILANDQVSTTLDKIGNKIGAFGTKSNRLAKNGGGFGFLKIAKWTAVFAVARRFGRTLQGIVQSGADYTETLNLWETAMGSNLNVATEFVNKMNEAYGISEKTIMNAQAIFKNMLGSLGQISDTMAYSLSEGITQMALDYASLYNKTFEQAFTKFQAALARQVRPIRSVAGYDITENTLYQLYQSLGGTKTMRQLTKTEKQLLSILAIFNQMTASGAVGDLDKTMESFANQSRVMAEAWQQVKTYAGVVLTKIIEDSGLLVNVNAILIFIGDTLKAVAESMGAIKHFGGDLFESTTESAMGASDAIDEVQGKLLDFDKFRAMSGGEENALGLDEKLLQALSGYDTILANANMEARNLAETLKEASGLFNKDGTFNIEKWNEFISTIKTTALLLGNVLVIVITKKVISAFQSLGKGIMNTIINFQELRVQNALATTSMQKLQVASGALLTGFVSLAMGVTTFIMAWGDMSWGERLTTIFVSLAAAIGAAAVALHLFKGNWAMAIGVGATVAGIGLTIGSQLSTINDFANGGLPDKGTVFRAGEAGAEIVYNTPSGQSGVANVQQIAQATRAGTLQAVKEWWSQARNDIPQFREVSKTGIYEVAKGEMVRRGEW